MTTTTDRPETLEAPTIPLDRIHHHPGNPRRTAVASAEMVESILAQGIHVPLMVAPHPDIEGDFVLVDGHRRENGARQAGLDVVPVNVRYDLTTEAQQLEVMVITGLQGEHLSPVEEAAAYEQLQLTGMDDDAIARATGFSKRRVRDRLKLNSLSTVARDSVHAGDVTLTDIAALEEFEDDHEAYAEVEAALGSPNFRSVVHGVRSRVERDRDNAAAVETLENLGAVRVVGREDAAGMCLADDAETTFADTKRIGSWMTDSLGEPDAHAGHLGWYLADHTYARVESYCLDTTAHPEWKTTPRPERDPGEWEKEQAAREAERERIAAADQARREWLTEHITGLLPTKSHQGLAALAGPFLVAAAYETGDDLPDDLATPTKTLAAFAARLAGEIAQILYQPVYGIHVDDRDQVLADLQLWDVITAAGYPMSDVDVEYRTRLETRLTELDDENDSDG